MVGALGERSMALLEQRDGAEVGPAQAEGEPAPRPPSEAAEEAMGPTIDKVEVDRESITRRARLYYLRDRIGKAAQKVKEKRLIEGKR